MKDRIWGMLLLITWTFAVALTLFSVGCTAEQLERTEAQALAVHGATTQPVPQLVAAASPVSGAVIGLISTIAISVAATAKALREVGKARAQKREAEEAVKEIHADTATSVSDEAWSTVTAEVLRRLSIDPASQPQPPTS